MLTKGIITKINSGTYTVLVDNNIYYDCSARGKFRNNKITPVVGDKVEINTEDKVIENVLERKNYLLRPPVANIDIALIITSIKSPNISLTLLDKLISIITINKIEPVIVWTKLDLASKKELKEINKLTKYYESIGIRVFNNKKINKLKKYIKKKLVTVCGQTGAGKSTLINRFDKKLNLETKEISTSLGRGVHTTRIVEIYNLNDFNIIDTPGFSAIDISSYSLDEIKNSFNEFKRLKCQWNNCSHVKEKGCQVIQKKNEGYILESRYNSYLSFIEELK